ncbi:hypothetical protein EXIGLDRAFT_827838 [Exidia glandulosa HHB12029]|uniref:Uncharacterized protein n=1 Tax=Exidia glandulosa HHB12029 TaxID=1314781 RepID=A0A165QPH6_EXIGL|nr:hypothetical protein EXIGLDRAFT_827838 [Exidia glandulosa HHB12029]
MPNWSSIEEILHDADVFTKLIFVLFGLYVWELCTTFQFDLDVMLGRRPFRWPLSMSHFTTSLECVLTSVAFYFASRYCMLMALIAVIVVLTITTKIDCQAMISFGQWAGNTAIAASSTCLMFRTIAIWERRRAVMIPLIILSLAQWGLLYHGIVTVKAAWVPALNLCNVAGTSAMFLNVMYFYTMAFDFIVLVLSTTGLLCSQSRSTVWHMLFRDGLVFFFSTFSANAVAAVLNVVNLNPVMNMCACVARLYSSSLNPVLAASPLSPPRLYPLSQRREPSYDLYNPATRTRMQPVRRLSVELASERVARISLLRRTAKRLRNSLARLPRYRWTPLLAMRFRSLYTSSRTSSQRAR